MTQPDQTSCCSPSSDRNARPVTPVPFGAGKGMRPNAKRILGGTALVGTAHPIIHEDAESPVREQKLEPFFMGETTVTNAEFAAFVDATGYQTEAERYGWSFVFWAQVRDDVGLTKGVANVQWWRQVYGANWRDLNGPETANSAYHPDHPVVQVSWNDARAYTDWIGARLPTEAEWEHAARAGQGDVAFPWGDVPPDEISHFPCNIWQGKFPNKNTCLDGYATTAPARSFKPNGFGLFNMVGNVWEWTAEPFHLPSKGNQRQSAVNGYKLIKGGSFLCHDSYCYRYRIAARTGNSPDSATTHMGFRVAWDA
ncbi:MAG: formylglycine-generating enzyme family protein [Paracoccaceae bacterium]